ncbi:hypothetical protein [Leifsonia shinshuensis]|uniref:hypothetical protein n=1 Tax=Leifsonia shinshuensis TaxID=150026 RepID=UPI00286BC99A|nr:hypothetical protein [Leifsonia shinshuensis]
MNPAISQLGTSLKLANASSPQEGTYPAKIGSAGGIFCDWFGADGSSVSVALVHLAPQRLAGEQSAVAASSTPSTILGTSPNVSVYVADSGGTASGDIEAFTDSGYWISVVSPSFTTPDRATDLLRAVLQALPSG